MTDIFAPAQIAGITFNNRMLRAAADETEGTSDGFPTDFLTRRYVTLAKGGVGGIITGYIGVSPEGRSQQPGMVLLDRDEKIEPLKKMTDAVHEAGAPIIAQIAHCGANGAGGIHDLAKNQEDHQRGWSGLCHYCKTAHPGTGLNT